MTRSSLQPEASLGFWFTISVACVIFLIEARRARANRHPAQRVARSGPDTKRYSQGFFSSSSNNPIGR
jgi:hypothetical protein